MRSRLLITFLAALVGPPCLPWLASSDAGRRDAGPTEKRGGAGQVDFSLPPKAGLEFRVDEENDVRLEGTLAVEGEPLRNIERKVRARLSLTQRIKAVEGHRVVSLERDYREYELHVHFVTRSEEDQDTQEWDHTHPLRGKHLRAQWKGDRFELEVQEGDAWKAADASLATRLSTRKLLHPVLPVPGTTKQVGDRWALTKDALADYFCDAFDCPPEKVELEGEGHVAFTGFAEHASGRCAVLVARFDVTVGRPKYPRSHFRLTGVCHYNLKHRIVVALDVEGTVETRGRLEKNGRTCCTIELRGTLKTRSEVEIAGAVIDPRLPQRR